MSFQDRLMEKLAAEAALKNDPRIRLMEKMAECSKRKAARQNITRRTMPDDTPANRATSLYKEARAPKREARKALKRVSKQMSKAVKNKQSVPSPLPGADSKNKAVELVTKLKQAIGGSKDTGLLNRLGKAVNGTAAPAAAADTSWWKGGGSAAAGKVKLGGPSGFKVRNPAASFDVPLRYEIKGAPAHKVKLKDFVSGASFMGGGGSPSGVRPVVGAPRIRAAAAAGGASKPPVGIARPDVIDLFDTKATSKSLSRFTARERRLLKYLGIGAGAAGGIKATEYGLGYADRNNGLSDAIGNALGWLNFSGKPQRRSSDTSYAAAAGSAGGSGSGNAPGGGSDAAGDNEGASADEARWLTGQNAASLGVGAASGAGAYHLLGRYNTFKKDKPARLLASILIGAGAAGATHYGIGAFSNNDKA